MGKRIFVRNLSFGSTEAGLQAHFEQAGHEVRSARIVLDRETGKSRGFGFVELVDDSRIDAAISALDGSFMDGRPISVREAHDQKPGGGPRGPREGRPPRGPRSFEGGGPRGPRPEGDFRGRPPRAEPFAGGFPPPPGDMPGERRRPPQKKKKKNFRSDDDDRGAFRDGDDRKGRRQRKHMRGGLDGDFEDW